MSNSLKRLATSVVALSTAFTGFVGLVTPVLADTPEVGGASVDSAVYKDADAVKFTFTVSDTGNDDNEVIVVYHGECVSSTLTAKEGQNTVTFMDVPDAEYALGDCKIVVVNSDGEFSDVLDVPAFTMDTKAPRISTVVDVETPTNDTTPTFAFFSDEEGDIVESGDCVITTPSVTSTSAATEVTLYSSSSSEALTGGTYANCKVKVVDDAGNESNVLSINSFEVVDYFSLDVQENSARPADPVNATSLRVKVVANVEGELTAAGNCEVYPRMINEGTTEVTLHSLVAGTDLTSNAVDCQLTLTPTDFETSPVTVEVDNLVITGSFTTPVAADTTAPYIPQTVAVLVPQTNKGVVGFSFTSNEGGTWNLADDTDKAGTCDISTPVTFADSDDAIVHPGTSARTYLLETSTALGNGTYGETGFACDIVITDANGQVTRIDMPTFTISDTKAPVLATYEAVRNQLTTGTVVFRFTSDEYVPAGLLDTNVSGDCFGAYSINSGSDVMSDINEISITISDEGEYKFCQFSIEDSAGNRSNSLVIPTFNVGLTGPELTDPQFPGGLATNPVTVSFESDEAGTFDLFSENGWQDNCSVNGETEGFTLQKGINTIVFDNLDDANDFDCTILPFDKDGVAGNPLVGDSDIYFSVDEDDTASASFKSIDTNTMKLTFNSATGGYLSFEEDSYCTSTETIVKKGLNTVQLNKLPAGTAVDSCKFVVTNNNDSDTVTVPPFTAGSVTNTLAKLPDGAIYRFYHKVSNKHVMTQDYNEANTIFTSNPNWVYEGQVFAAYKYDKTTNACLDGAMPVYRYVNSAALSFVYVMSQAEMDALATNPAWIKEGVVFCAKDKDVTDAGTVKVIRFWNGAFVSHVYTIDPTEAAQIQTNPAWVLEGTAFVVKPKMAQ